MFSPLCPEGINLWAPGDVKDETAGVCQPAPTWSLSQRDRQLGAAPPESVSTEGTDVETSLAALWGRGLRLLGLLTVTWTSMPHLSGLADWKRVSGGKQHKRGAAGVWGVCVWGRGWRRRSTEGQVGRLDRRQGQILKVLGTPSVLFPKPGGLRQPKRIPSQF